MPGKGGLGVYHGRDGIDDALTADAVAVLLADDARGSAARIKAAQPGTKVIARKINTDERGLILQGAAGGRVYARQCIAECPDADAYLPINEAIPGYDAAKPTEQKSWLDIQSAFEWGFTDECYLHGKRAVVCNAGPAIIPAGDVPGQVQWWVDAYKRIVEHPACLWWGVHLYGSGNDPYGRLEHGDPNWFFLRYRRFYDLMVGADVRMKPLCATEWGQTRGWRGVIPEYEAVDDLLWSLDQVRNDARIACLLYFLDGRNFPGPWDSFDIYQTSIPSYLREWNRENPVPVQPAPPPNGGGQPVSTVRIGNLDVIDLRGKLPTHPTLRYEQRSLGGIQTIVIHHSATAGDASAETIAAYHVNSQGWPGIAYHFLVHQDGRTEYCQPIEIVSYGVARRNEDTMHICLPGDWTANPPPEAQLAATRRLIDNLDYALGIVYPVVGHSEIAPSDYATSCPGATWPRWKGRLVNVVPVTVDWEAKARELTVALSIARAELTVAKDKISAAKVALA